MIDRRLDGGAPVEEAPVALLPDTSLTPKGMPVFLPDFCREGWELRAVTAYRVGRLGKSIGERFAGRYVDGVTQGALLMPRDGVRRDTALLCGFDSSLTLGDFVAPCDELECAMGEQVYATDGAGQGIAAAIARVSRYCTLRTGDIVIPALGPVALEAEIGLRAELRLNGADVRTLRVK